MRRVVAWAGALLALGAPSVAHAQFVKSGPNLSEAAGDSEALDETAYKGRLSTSGVYYAESADKDGNTQESSPFKLLYTDVRGRLEATHVEGSRWDAVGDVRLRLAPSNNLEHYNFVASRGYLGQNEYQLKDAYFNHRGDDTDVTVGRQTVLDVDATRIDGIRFTHRFSPQYELGAFAGLYPNPFSRSLDTDYRTGRTLTQMPVALGSWVGYRFANYYGAVGVGGILPRDDATMNPDPNRELVTSQGYWRFVDAGDVYHYLVVDVAGEGGQQIMNGQLGFHYHWTPRFLFEAGVSHMSTYALSIYVRDLLTNPMGITAIAGAPGINNLVLARMAADEGRVGGNYNLLDEKVDIYAEVRYRRRTTLDVSALPPEVGALPADKQLEISGGARKKDWIGGWTLGASVVDISGDRTSSYYVTARGSQDFMDKQLGVGLDLTYVGYTDSCKPAVAGVPPDATCTGDVVGTNLEGGADVSWIKDKNWMAVVDLRGGRNSATVAGKAQPPITELLGFARVQYTF